MAGPKAPIGQLSEHVSKSSALARGASNNKKSSTMAATKGKNLKEESESESSDSDSDASDLGEVDHDEVLRAIASKSSASKSKGETKVPVSGVKKANLKKEESSSGESSESESESESEDDSSSKSEDEKKVEPSKGAKLAKKSEAVSDKGKTKEVKKTESEDESDSSSSDSSSESESDDEEEKPAPKAVAKSSEARPKSKPETSSSSSSEATSSSSDSDEEADESIAIDEQNGNNALVRNQVPEIVANEFLLRKAEDGTNAADVAQFFSEAKKEGKQIWYFTAPASIPIEVVEKLEIPLERAQNGQSILSHNGDDYGVAFEDAATSRAIKLLIPSKGGDKYSMLNAPIAQTMHLKRVTQFSQDGASTLSLTQTGAAPSRSFRPQPKGLKARFAPIGIPSSSPVKIGSDASDEDVDMTEAPDLPSSQKTPAKKSKSKDADTTDKKKKRKLDAAADTTSAGTPEPSKKAKKARVDAEPTPKTKADVSSSQVGKVTPILPPAIPSIRLPSSSQAPASTPSSTKVSKATAAATEPSSSAIKKESAIPLPANFRRSSSSHSSQPAVEEPKTNGKAKKERKSKAAKADAAASDAPKKTTPVPVPNFPTS